MYVCVLCVCMSCILLCSFVLIKPYGWIFFIYWLHWDFVAMCGLSLVMVSGGYSLTAVCRLHIVVASLVEHSLQARGLQQLQLTGSRVWAQQLQDTRACLLHSMWKLPRPGIKPMSPALACRFLTTGPSGKSLTLDLTAVLSLSTSTIVIYIFYLKYFILILAFNLFHIYAILNVQHFSSPFLPSLQWHPTPVLLPEKSHGRRSLVGCSPWGH